MSQNVTNKKMSKKTEVLKYALVETYFEVFIMKCTRTWDLQLKYPML